MNDYVVRASLTANEKAARNNRLFEIKLSSAKKKELNLSRLGFTPLAPGEQLVFNPESMMTAEDILASEIPRIGPFFAEHCQRLRSLRAGAR